MSDTRKQAIIQALRAFVEARPGFDHHNYATMRDYRQDQRRAQRQLHDARTLLAAVEGNDAITADVLLKEASSGGRLTITERWHQYTPDECPGKPCGACCDHRSIIAPRVDYCPGQYWCVEFRAGVCRLLSAVLWTWQRDNMPQVGTAPVGSGKAQEGMYYFAPTRKTMSAGDWLRATFRERFGKSMQQRWFD